RERLGLLAAGPCLHITAQYEQPLTLLSRSKPSGPDPTAHGLRGSSSESRGSPDIQFVACHVSHTDILLHRPRRVVELKGTPSSADTTHSGLTSNYVYL